MRVLLPAGMIRFRAVLARVAKLRLPEAWSAAKQNERDWLVEEAEADGFQRRLFTRPDAVAGRAYQAIRPSLAEGLLPASWRGQSGPPEAIDVSFWTSRAADRFEGLAIGDILIREADIAAVLKGELAPSLLSEDAQASESTKARPKSGRKRGRPHKEGFDDFWIEACRFVHEEGIPTPPAKLTSHMLKWAHARLGDDAYTPGSIRDKVGKLLSVLERSGAN